ncbi:hypothetical protein FY528_11980 [Hymenobacter lutimineralis]|uniref:3D domain-containing protein n=1 Tax=Hymenobacter lutimineralis TaxID=2606448 RepID=A0A5D6UZU3_9BACT|nr:hypothetical protein [Hymenobacter lutimineralis]TYZ08926.1 hypothetical protein FY528_11980 [Hymenobacter lutimineralis]
MSIALFLLNLIFAPQTALLPAATPSPAVFTVVAPPILEARPISVQSNKLSNLPSRLPHYTVTATVYTPSVDQTDDEPFITADNSRIPRNHSSKTRWVALSRDLLQRWGGPLDYGDAVRISGLSPELDGVYTVHDTMNRRHRHCIDVLMNEREIEGRMDDIDFGRWEKVKITKVTSSSSEWSEG